MIPLYINNGVAYVWNSDDWFTLRSDHRICGVLIGSIATKPRQNEFLGMPLALMGEEAALLVEKNICELVELPDLSKKPTLEEKNEIVQCEERIKEEQIEVLRKKRIENMSQKIDIILVGKKQKLLSKGITDIKLDKEALLQEEISRLPPLTPSNLLVHLPTEHYRNSERRTVSVEVLKPSVMDRKGMMRYSIFKDLWEKGHYVTNGLKFGCDYLVYPGDPVKFHATYMVRCISNSGINFQPRHIVAFGRLAVAVNKLAVLAFIDSFGNVHYQTLQWHDNVNN